MPESIINVNGDSVQVLEILFIMTVISLLPSVLVMMTSFTRYIISLSFLRNAMGTQQSPPNIVLTGIAIFLTLMTMSPVLTQVYNEAYVPYSEEAISQEEFLSRASEPLKRFMLENTETSTLETFCELADVEMAEGEDAMDISMTVVVPAFMTSELKRAFMIGFLLYIPFMLIDLVVASTLMSMGMVMLPPSMISMPFKLLLFISIDGWELLFSTLIQGFN